MPICLRLLTHWIRLRRLACGLDGGQEQRDQDRDDRDDHQQFDQGEAAICRGTEGGGDIGRRPFRRDGREGPAQALPARGARQTVCERPARMLVAEASEQNSTGRSSGSRLVTDPGPPSRLAAVARMSGGLADHSGGPATDSHRLPYSPPSLAGGGTCRGRSLESFGESVSMAGMFESGRDYLGREGFELSGLGSDGCCQSRVAIKLAVVRCERQFLSRSSLLAEQLRAGLDPEPCIRPERLPLSFFEFSENVPSSPIMPTAGNPPCLGMNWTEPPVRGLPSASNTWPLTG